MTNERSVFTPEVLPRERFEPEDYVRGIDAYLEDAELNQTLRSDQLQVFHDIRAFFADGERKGYITLPTGTGKTVIFVELSKALLLAEKPEGAKPKILVVTSKKDLVHQTLGRTGEKGYGKFAPDLHVGSFYSDSTDRDQQQLSDFDVVVTTYKSFNIMRKREELRDRSPQEIEQEGRATIEEYVQKHGTGFERIGLELPALHGILNMTRSKRATTGRVILDSYDMVILDEAHHVLGKIAGEIVEEAGPEKCMLGFTATPDASQKKKLRTYLPREVHKMDLKEAISMELLAPLAIAGIKSDTKIEGNDLYGTEGDYREEKLSNLARSPSRNRAIVKSAKILTERGLGVIIGSIPGEEALHARILAEQLRHEGVNAEAVYGKMPSGKRREIYQQFEKGEIDALTYVDILGEGWDSNRAKAIINARPTRSMIIAQQRLGRILRLGGPAIALDVIDEYDLLNPPLHVADVLNDGDLSSGTKYGKMDSEEETFVAEALAALDEQVNIAPVVKADYERFYEALADFPQVVSGVLQGPQRGHYAISSPSRLSQQFEGLTDEIIEKTWELAGLPVDKKLGSYNYTLRAAYNAVKTTELLRGVPEGAHDKYYVDGEQRKWASSEGIVKLFSKKYPTATKDIVEILLDEMGDTIEWRPLRVVNPATRSAKRNEGVFKAYIVTQETVNRLDTQLAQYFEIVSVASRDK